MSRPTIACTLTAYTDPVYLDAVKAIEPEGIKITGNGTLPHPLKVELSGVYKAAPELLKVLKTAVEIAEKNYQSQCFEADWHNNNVDGVGITQDYQQRPSRPKWLTDAHELIARIENTTYTGEPDPCDEARELLDQTDQPTPYDL